MSAGTIWDERFKGDEFVYGREPNLWLAAQTAHFPPAGQALALGDGEGRNGVWLAGRGFRVTAVDSSSVGLEKAQRLARESGCAERYLPVCSQVQDWSWPVATFAVAALIYLHVPSVLRREMHGWVARSLAPGGLLVLEAFTPRQLAFRTGGPSDADLLYEPEELRRDFAGLEILQLEETELDLQEGRLHRGRSAVVRVVARG